jgi:hypothetical protein
MIVKAAATSQSEVYLSALQEMLKMFPIGLDTILTPLKQILAHMLSVFGYTGCFKMSEFFCV